MIFSIAEIEGYTVTCDNERNVFLCAHGIAQNFELIVSRHKKMVTACIVESDGKNGSLGVIEVSLDEFGDVLMLEAVKAAIELVNK